MKKYQRVAALIDLDAIEENFEAMRAGLPAGTKMAAVVKANGYGHGAVPIARLLESKDAAASARSTVLGRAARAFSVSSLKLGMKAANASSSSMGLRTLYTWPSS